MEMGADVVKLNMPKINADKDKDAPAPYNEMQVDQAEAIRQCVESAGRSLVVLSGGSKVDDETVLGHTREVMEAGGSGVIFGRNVWQREWNDALEIIAQIKETLLSSVRRIPVVAQRARRAAAAIGRCCCAARSSLLILRPGRTAGPRPAARAAARAFVVRVVDGDTIEAQIGDRVEDVRYIGVDTPETVKPDTPVQCFGPQASAFNHRLVEQRQVRLVFGVERRDVYGRLLAYVYLGAALRQRRASSAAASPAR